MIPYRLIAYAVIAAAIAASAGWGGYKLADNIWAAKWNKAAAENQTAIAAQQAENRQIEQDWSTKLHAAEASHAKDLQTVQNARKRSDTESRGLRDALAAIGARGPATDSLDACRNRAARLGELFAEADGEAGRMADAAELHAADLAKMIAAWPNGGSR